MVYSAAATFSAGPPVRWESGICFGGVWFSEPVLLASGRLPQTAGIYVLLEHSSDWLPRPYRPVCFGEASNLNESLEWQPLKLVAAPLYVAFCPLMFTSALERDRVRRQLALAYRLERPASPPLLPQLPAAAMERRMADLEQKCNAQADQLKSIMNALAGVVEARPDKPRRPIGFVTAGQTRR